MGVRDAGLAAAPRPGRALRGPGLRAGLRAHSRALHAPRPLPARRGPAAQHGPAPRPAGRPRPPPPPPPRAAPAHGRFALQAPRANAWERARAWPGAELVVVDDAGHGAPAALKRELRR